MQAHDTLQVMSDADLDATEGGNWLGWLYIAVDEVMDFYKGFTEYQPTHEVVWSTISYE